MNDIEREVIEIKHRQDLRDQEEQHSREENENQHAQMSGRIDSVIIRIDGHDIEFKEVRERLSTVENKGTTLKVKAVDGVIKWFFIFLGGVATAGGMFLLGTIFGGGK